MQNDKIMRDISLSEIIDNGKQLINIGDMTYHGITFAWKMLYPASVVLILPPWQTCSIRLKSMVLEMDHVLPRLQRGQFHLQIVSNKQIYLQFKQN